MTTRQAIGYLSAYEGLAAEETLRAVTAAAFPHMKKGGMDRVHRDLVSMAKRAHVVTEPLPAANTEGWEDSFAKLAGAISGGKKVKRG